MVFAMKIVKKVLLWFAVAFFLIMAIGGGGVSSVFALIPVALLLPIKKWQDIISKFLNNKIKIIAVVLAFVLMIGFFPKADTTVGENDNTEVTETLLQENESSSLKDTENKTTTRNKSETASSTEEITKEEKTTEKVVDTTKDSKTKETTKKESTAKESTTKESAKKESTTKATNTSTSNNNNKETTTKVASNITTVHIHNFIAATCLSPKTCTDCGITEGTANGHNYYNGVCDSCGVSDPDYVSEEMVWIPTRGGQKYHSSSTCSKMIDPEYVSKTEAINRGFGPCGKCY